MTDFRAIDGERDKDVEEFRPPEYSDESLALMFAEKNKDRLRYVAKWSQWFNYDGQRWAEDSTLDAFDRVRHLCREVAAGCTSNKSKVASLIASGKTVAAVEKLARYDRRMAAGVDQWDADPWLLNTPDGVINLRTGVIRGHRADDYMMKMAAVAPGGDCPRFRAFINQITDGDVDLQAFHARMFGYAATGSTREQALFFCYGTGNNGKSLLLGTASNVLGSYAQTAPIETFTDSRNDRHPTELADLHGARLVTAVETEEGRNWAEAKIKQLTGSDPIRARFMRQDFFQYVPQFKLVIAGNHKPSLRSVDEAIKRRFNLIPFTVFVPPDKREKDLAETLKAEWHGILQWIIDGCLEWQRIGLQPPKAVIDATAAYLAAEDMFKAWIAEKCQTHPQARELSSKLFASYRHFAETAGEAPGTQKRFSTALEVRGFKPDHTRIGTVFSGISLNRQMTGDDP